MKHEAEIKIIKDISLEQIWDNLDVETLFSLSWQLRQKKSSTEWEKTKDEIGKPTLSKMIEICTINNLFVPEAIYGRFPCRKINNGLYIEHDGKSFRFDFPRERKHPNRCVADFFTDGFITLALVTLGDRIADFSKKLFLKHNYSDLFYIKGLVAQSTEALMKYVHSFVRKNLNIDETVGERFSFGYPSAPDLSNQKKLVDLLKGEMIGVGVTHSYQLNPEYSTSAIISIDPNAKRFIP